MPESVRTGDEFVLKFWFQSFIVTCRQQTKTDELIFLLLLGLRYSFADRLTCVSPNNRHVIAPDYPEMVWRNRPCSFKTFLYLGFDWMYFPLGFSYDLAELATSIVSRTCFSQFSKYLINGFVCNFWETYIKSAQKSVSMRIGQSTRHKTNQRTG